jgi:hypothetical protein
MEENAEEEKNITQKTNDRTYEQYLHKFAMTLKDVVKGNLDKFSKELREWRGEKLMVGYDPKTYSDLEQKDPKHYHEDLAKLVSFPDRNETYIQFEKKKRKSISWVFDNLSFVNSITAIDFQVSKVKDDKLFPKYKGLVTGEVKKKRKLSDEKIKEKKKFFRSPPPIPFHCSLFIRPLKQNLCLLKQNPYLLMLLTKTLGNLQFHHRLSKHFQC